MKKIEKQVELEFKNLKNSFKTHLEGNFDLVQRKDFLVTYMSSEIMYKSEIFFDTLLNELMRNAVETLDNFDDDIEIKFYEADFRNKIKDCVSQNEFNLNIDVVKNISDDRLINGIITGGITGVVGLSATFIFNPLLSIGAIISSIAVAVLSIVIYKIIYNKSEINSIIKLKEAVDVFLEVTENEIKKWLKLIEDLFYSEINHFAEENKINLNLISN
jgi:hypothetical protein